MGLKYHVRNFIHDLEKLLELFAKKAESPELRRALLDTLADDARDAPSVSEVPSILDELLSRVGNTTLDCWPIRIDPVWLQEPIQNKAMKSELLFTCQKVISAIADAEPPTENVRNAEYPSIVSQVGK